MSFLASNFTFECEVFNEVNYKMSKKYAFLNRPMKTVGHFLTKLPVDIQGSNVSWKVLECLLENFQDLENPGNNLGPGKSRKYTCKVLESPGIC